ncbi:metal-binding protein [Deinococcus arcticus]|uniref:Hydrolase n=1 Tax=Deinococcus arcticus TaxID=2136176 RepID=A0A2T3WBZ4_9DEIO|nr:metal-binding protein [Deinococcus arcticus]PTA69334.1 hydrolase [Deinococcus arcticus]
MAPVPSGRVHNLINIAAYSVLAAGALIATRQELVVLSPAQALQFTLAFAAGTFLLSPDLDLAEGRVDSKRHWGVLGVLWVPYGMLFSHRGWSHTWLVGPLTRLLYVALIAALVWGALLYLVPGMTLPQWPQTFTLQALWPPLLGYYLSQWLHLMADGVRPDHGARRARRR